MFNGYLREKYNMVLLIFCCRECGEHASVGGTRLGAAPESPGGVARPATRRRRRKSRRPPSRLYSII